MTAPDAAALARRPVDADRVAWLIRDTARRIAEAEETIAREAAAIKTRAGEIAADLAAGRRIHRSVYTANLDGAITARQAGYDLLVALVGPDAAGGGL